MTDILCHPEDAGITGDRKEGGETGSFRRSVAAAHHFTCEAPFIFFSCYFSQWKPVLLLPAGESVGLPGGSDPQAVYKRRREMGESRMP